MNKNYEINITYKCNWKCPYCAVKERLFSKIDENEILNKILSLPNDVNLTLSGGEPGLCNYDFLNKIFNIASEKNIKLKVNTNGTFILKYPFLAKKAKCNVHIDKNHKINFFENVEYTYVLTNNDDPIDFLDKFYLKNIKVNIVPSSHNDDSINEYTLKNIKSVLKYKKYMSNNSIIQILKKQVYDNIIFLN